MSTSEINNLDDHENYHDLRRSISEPRNSMHSSDDQGTPIIIEDEDDEVLPLPPPPPPEEIKTYQKPKQSSQIPKLKNSQTVPTSIANKNPKPSSSLKWNSSSKNG